MAVDFFGLGNSLVENDSGRRQGEADSSVPPVKPIASIQEKQVVEMSRAVTPLSESERAIGKENSISILRQGNCSSLNKSDLCLVAEPVVGLISYCGTLENRF